MCLDCDISRSDGSKIRARDCGELAAALRMEFRDLPLNCPDPRGPIEAAECLCWVDVPALAERHGMIFEEPDYSPGSDRWDAYALRERVGELGGEER